MSDMMQRIIRAIFPALLAACLCPPAVQAQVSIGRCMELARENYPQVRQLGLIEEAGEADGPAAKETGRLFRLNREKYDELTRKGEWLGLQAAALPPATEKG